MSLPKHSRRLRRLLVSLTAISCVMAVIAPTRPAFAQTTSWTVSTGSDLSDALAEAFQNNVTNPSLVNTITLSASISGSSQWIVNANLNIVGGGYTIDMQNADRAFFIAGGAVNVRDLTITNGRAAGGDATIGGGGGAGLGGGIFVGSGTYSTGNGSPAILGLSAPVVVLQDVSFHGNRASGGRAYLTGNNQPYGGGGGGMGGTGGSVNYIGFDIRGSGGGGGFGNDATGGEATSVGGSGGLGSFVNLNSGTSTTSGGPGGNGESSNGGTGGLYAGGGGGGGLGGNFGNAGSGGGGGLGGGRGYFQNDDPPDGGGDGGFGGGGGVGQNSPGGAGGFGGGGGASGSFDGGNGSGGFGAGAGAQLNPNLVGGGGLGAGGAVFAMGGASLTIIKPLLGTSSFAGNTVAAGLAGHEDGIVGNDGSAYGVDFFLGADTTFDVSGGESLSLASLGGAGNLSDANVAGNASDPNAQGGVIKTGAGTLVLTGSSYYSGVTTIHSGTLALAAGAMEQGTTVVTVGQNAGDVATLVLGSSSNLTLGGFGGAGGTDAPIVIAQAAGSTGTIIIGDGAASSGADLGARIITGGSGTATLRFTQQFAAGSASDPLYPFYTTLTGSLALVQEGIGTTSLQPLYGANTFAGAVTVNAGVLATTGSAAALAGVTEITVNSGGTLALGQSDGVNNLAGFTLAGGVLQTGTSLSETFGALAVTGSTSLIDFLGNAATLNFATLDLGGQLSIWNYSGATDFFEIATGTATGSLDQISFYSDAGTTFLGYGGFESTRIVPVPEPSTIAMALAGLAAGGILRRRRKRAVSPHASSPS